MRTKIITVCLVLLCFTLAYAALVPGGPYTEGDEISFAWDANTTDVDLAGYKIYRFPDENGVPAPQYLLADIQCGMGNTSVACTTWSTTTTPVGTWYWKITAYDLAGQESQPSENILVATVNTYNPVPLPPDNWRFDVTP